MLGKALLVVVLILHAIKSLLYFGIRVAVRLDGTRKMPFSVIIVSMVVALGVKKTQ